jgi:hypothetical protein
MAICLTPLVARAEEPPADRIVIDVVTVNGSGCPAGNAAVAVAPDNTAFTVTFSDFTSGVGPGFSPSEFRKNCQLALRVHVPQGFTYAIAGYDHVGFLSLAAGARATLRSDFYFSGAVALPLIFHNFQGPLVDDFHVSDRVDPAALIFKPCGEERILNLRLEERVLKGTSAPDSTSFMTLGVDGPQQQYPLVWKRCQ